MKSRDVEFYSRGQKIIGTLYLPDDYTEGTKLPCIIPCSGFTGIKAAYPALFARLFTRHGYAALGFDYRGWAPSEGEPGQTTAEDEYFDIVAAYVFAQQQSEVDPQNIGLFGWGFAAPIVLKVAADHPEIKAVGCGNGIYNGDRRLRNLLTYADYKALKELAYQDRVQRVLTGKGARVFAYYVSGSQLLIDGYHKGRFLPVTLETMQQTPPRKEGEKRPRNFMDTIGASEAIEKHYGKENFPPMHSLETLDSFMRIDASWDVKKVYPRPIFIVHAVDDEVYPVSEAEFMAKEIGPTCTTCYVTGGHNGWMFDDHPEWIRFSQEIVKFYDDALK